ncbi:MAG: alkaline phosphatase family protein [Terriglobia bacterium]
MADPRVVLLGLDGATFTVIDSLVARGRLPHLAAVMREGVRATLESTVPPHSAAAWPSLVTGKNPGRHGLFDFYRRRPGSYRLELINGGCVPGPKLWDFVSAAGKRVCVYNVPITYPPEPLNGIMLSGMDTPSQASEFAYPPSFKPELLARFPHYSIEIDELESALRRGTREPERDLGEHRREMILAQLEQQLAAIDFLLAREAWDLFFGVIVASDRAQHLFWSDFEALQRPGNALTSRTSALLAAYEKTDAAIGEWRARYPGRHWIILSDHGFGRLEKEFYLDQFLADLGLLRLRSPAARAWRLGRSAIRKIHRVGRPLKGLAQHGLRRWRQGRAVAALPSWVLDDPERAVDWGRSRAYAIGDTGAIFINLEGREPQGIVKRGGEYEAVRDEIINALRQLRDPEDGLPVVDAVYRREELHAGEWLSVLPDLYVRLRNDAYRVAVDLSAKKGRLFGLPQERKPILYDTGTHHREGILLAAGPSFEPGQKLPRAHLLDLTPTVLYALGLPVEEGLDGQVLLSAFSPAYVEAHPVQRGGRTRAGVRAPSGYSHEEEQQVSERLRQLGYLD